MKSTNQQGNALFLILIAVALFAALSFAITKSSSTGASVDPERARLVLASVMQYVGSIEMTIGRLKLTNGCKDNEISFENPIKAGYINASAPVSKKCHVFDPEGGGLAWQNAPKELALGNGSSYGVWRISGTGEVGGVGEAARAEIVMFIAIDDGSSWGATKGRLHEQFCYLVNKMGGVTPLDSGNTLNIGNLANFQGAFGDAALPNSGSSIGDDAPTDVFRGKHTGCLWGMSHSGAQLFYHVLLAR